jgi:predicted DNA-binding transcriptional regulator YafY
MKFNRENNYIMGVFELIERINLIHELILRETTGSPDEFAKRLKIHRRQLYNILNELKDYGAGIKYDRIKRTYYYTNRFEVSIKLFETKE